MIKTLISKCPLIFHESQITQRCPRVSERRKAEFNWESMLERKRSERRLTFLHGVVKVAVVSQRGEDSRQEVGQVLLGVRPGGNLLCNLSLFLQDLLLLGNSVALRRANTNTSSGSGIDSSDSQKNKTSGHRI